MSAPIVSPPLATLKPASTHARPMMRTLALVRTAFGLLLTYYWALQYASTPYDEVQRGDALYYLYIIPVTVFCIALLPWVRLSRRSHAPALWIISYMLVVALIAAVRADFRTIVSMALFTAGVVVVFAYRLVPSVNLLNRLFVASIVAESISFLLDRSIYAVLPGFSHDGELWWRISLFPNVAPSAFFALIVLFVNLLRRGGSMRWPCTGLAVYFLIFSGIRSGLVAALISGLYVGLVRMGMLKRPSAKITYLVVALAVFVTSLFATQLLLLLPNFGSEGLNVYLFRSESGLKNEDDVAKSFYRAWLWTEHLRIASTNPVFGIGTFDFSAIANFDPIIGGEGTGSESFLTGLYARVGLPTLLLVAAFVSAVRHGAHAGDHLKLVIGLLMFVAMLSYGSFITVYDFVFLIMVGLLAGPSVPKRLERWRADPQLVSTLSPANQHSQPENTP